MSGIALKALLLISAAGLAAAGGGYIGYTTGRAPVLVELANERTQHAEIERLRASDTARTLQAAQELGNRISTQLAQRQTHIKQLDRQHHATLQPYLSQRPCFNRHAVGVLNSDTTTAAADVPSATRAPVTEDGAFATDTDVGGWITHAKAAYADCTARLDALIDWTMKKGSTHED